MMKHTVSLLCLASTAMLFAACSVDLTDSEGRAVAAVEGDLTDSEGRTFEGEDPVCGLFRGGLSEADDMIASPNPEDSIEDSDNACIAYCDASNPEPGDVCARGGNVIKTYEDTSAQPVCGLFRGGLSEADDMVASPNPADSVEDSDEACIAYCDASNPEPGDVCARGGNVIKTYEDPAAQPVCGLFRGGLSEADNMIASPNPANSVEDSDEACIAYCDASNPEPGDDCARGGNVIETY
jgi:hypothetical protein